MANILSSNFSREGGCREDQQHGILGFWVGSSAIICTFGLAAGSCSSLKSIYCMILIGKLSFRGLECDYCTFAILYGAVNTKFTQLQHEVRGSVIHP